MSATISFYDKNAILLAQQYDSLAFESVHQSWSQYWPTSGLTVLDVGAGSGRDARWMSERGCSVVAVEPSIRLRNLLQQSCSEDVICLDDSLPYLSHVVELAKRYDLVMLSAVWMHIPIEQRSTAIKVLSDIMVDDGILVITLRHGGFKDGRENFDVSASELDKLADDFGLICCHLEDNKDFLMREGVMWQTVVMKKNSGLEG